MRQSVTKHLIPYPQLDSSQGPAPTGKISAGLERYQESLTNSTQRLEDIHILHVTEHATGDWESKKHSRQKSAQPFIRLDWQTQTEPTSNRKVYVFFKDILLLWSMIKNPFLWASTVLLSEKPSSLKSETLLLEVSVRMKHFTLAWKKSLWHRGGLDLQARCTASERGFWIQHSTLLLTL